MERSFSEALKQRRTYYSITNQSPISDQEIECIVNMTVRHVPSAFNSQSTRVVLLLGESHKKLWQIVKDALKKIVPAEAFVKTEEKIDHSFACGYGTVLFFEDQKVVGIDPDIAQAVCDVLGYDLKIEDMEFDAIVNAVVSGKADFGAAGMTVTDERKLSVDFTDTYATASQVIIVTK